MGLDVLFDPNYIPRDGDSFSVTLSTVGARFAETLTTSPELQELNWEGLTLESDCYFEDYGGYGLTIASQESTSTGTVEVFFTMEETQCVVLASAPHMALAPLLLACS